MRLGARCSGDSSPGLFEVSSKPLRSENELLSPKRCDVPPLRLKAFLMMVLATGCVRTISLGQEDGGQADRGQEDRSVLDVSSDVADLGSDARRDASLPTPGAWVVIAARTFTMGSPPEEACREPNEAQHTVELTRDYEIMATELTRAQFLAQMGYDPTSDQRCGPSCPVTDITWHEAAAFCNALSLKAGLAPCYVCSGKQLATSCLVAEAFAASNYSACPGYRLPTDAEWEHAYRADTTTALYNGALENCQGSDPRADEIAWHSGNSGERVHQGGQKAPNPWGLYDMAGNVYDWCYDWNSTLDDSPSTDPVGPSTGSAKVVRGGSFTHSATFIRAANRGNRVPYERYNHVGARCVRSLKP